MYWLDRGGPGVPRKLARANLDGSDVETLVSDHLYNPSHLALDTDRMVVYWTDEYSHKVCICYRGPVLCACRLYVSVEHLCSRRPYSLDCHGGAMGINQSINVKFVGRRYTRRPGAPTVVSGTHDQKVHS